jgi:hypothetical protein
LFLPGVGHQLGNALQSVGECQSIASIARDSQRDGEMLSCPRPIATIERTPSCLEVAKRQTLLVAQPL